MHPRGDVDTEKLEERGQEIHGADLRVDPDPAQRRERCRQEEGDAKGVVVHEIAVARLAVAAQGLAVVAHHDDDGPVLDPLRPQPRKAAPHLLVGEGDLSVVEAAQAAPLVLRAEGLRGLVGSVRVVQMDPREERPLLVDVEPREGGVHDLVGRSLHGPQVQVLVLPEVEAVVVDVEALIEAPAPVQHERRDPGSRGVASLRKRLGDRGLGRAQGRVAVDAHPVVGGVGAGHDRGVRRQRQRRGGRGLGEEHPAARQRVDVGGLDVGIAVGAQVIGAGRVQGDEQDVGLLDAPLRPRPAHDLARVRRRSPQPPRGEGARQQGARQHVSEPPASRSPALHRPSSGRSPPGRFTPAPAGPRLPLTLGRRLYYTFIKSAAEGASLGGRHLLGPGEGRTSMPSTRVSLAAMSLSFLVGLEREIRPCAGRSRRQGDGSRDERGRCRPSRGDRRDIRAPRSSPARERPRRRRGDRTCS